MEKMLKIFFSPKTVLFIALAALVISLHSPIESFITKIFVNTLFSKIQSAWYNDLLFTALCIFTISLTVYRFRRYHPSASLLWFVSLTAVVYSCYRINPIIWIFTPLHVWPEIAYSDLIYLIFFCLVILHKYPVELPKNSPQSLRDDEALGEERQDELGYTEYANRVADKIKISHFKNSFAIGITGLWGSGKTSFIDLIKRKLDNKDIIIVNFNPWNSHNPKAMIQDFFETVQAETRPYHSSLSRMLLQYSNKLAALNDNIFSRSIQTTVVQFAGSDSVTLLFNEINNTLEKIAKKIVVFIDDLDRLDKKEIIEVIRLIRNTANFYNTYFIVAYDKNYISAAIKQYNEHNHERFLEKIFQLELTLPLFKREILRHKLVQNLKEVFPPQYHIIFEQEIIGTVVVRPTYLNNWIETMRDVTRLTNSMIVNLGELIGEVEFFDFLRLELIRLKYQSVYELLYKNQEDFLVASKEHEREFTYVLKEIDKSQKNLSEEDRKYTYHLEQYLYEADNYKKLSVPRSEIDKVIGLIAAIFSKSKGFGMSKRTHLSVVHPSKFDRYFSYSLPVGNLSEIEFSRGREQSQEEFNKLITSWVESGHEDDLQERFSRIRAFDSREDFEKIIRGIFHLANQKTKYTNYSRERVGFDGQNLLSKLNNYDRNIVTKFYPGPKGPQNYGSFVRSLFEVAKHPFEFESEVAMMINNDINDDFGLPKEEFEKILLAYLKSHVRIAQRLDDTTWKLFHRCRRSNRIDRGNNTFTRTEEIIPEARPILQESIDKYIDDFLLAVTLPETFNKKLFSVSQFVLGQYGSWQGFKDFIEKLNESEWKYLKEFKEFFAVFEASNFGVYVPFTFKIIPIHLRTGDPPEELEEI